MTPFPHLSPALQDVTDPRGAMGQRWTVERGGKSLGSMRH